MIPFFVKNCINFHLPLQGEGWVGDGGLRSHWDLSPIPTLTLPLKGRGLWSFLMKNGMTRTFLLWSCIFSYFIVGPALAGSIKNSPKIIVETEYSKGELPLISRTLADGSELLSGNFHIRANVQLPLNDQKYVFKRQPIELLSTDANDSIALSAPRLSAQSNISDQSQLPDRNDLSSNILNADELWLTYRATSGSNQCGLSVDIETEGIPYKRVGQTTLPSAIPLKLFSRSRHLRSDETVLDGVKILPRDISYLIKRHSGMNPDSDWRLVEEKNRHVVMRLLRVDLRDISSIELAMNDTNRQVNFRLSRMNTGKPTDILTWDAIPKDVFMRGGNRWVRLDLANAIRQQMPEALDASTPLTLVEIIAFVQKDAVSNTVAEAPIRVLRANYSEPVSGMGVDDIELPVQIERAGPDKWRWRISMVALNYTKLDEIKFLRGRITPHKKGCIAAIEQAEFVSMATRKVPAALTKIQDSARSLGGPFGLAREDDDEMELPKLLAHLPLGKVSGTSLTLPPGGRQVWGDMGLTVTSRGALPLALTLDAGRLLMKGGGDVGLSWASSVSLPAHAYLSVRPSFYNDAMRGTRVRLRFSDGYTETLPYALGEAISLHKFAGRRLVGADVFLRLPTKGGAVSIAEMALFTVKVVNATQAFKETLIADRMLDAYRVKLGNIEYAPKQPTASFWRDLAKGQAWLDYGDVYWGGGEAIPVLSSLNPMLGMVNEWRFVYRGGADARLQASLAEPLATAADTGNPHQRWLKLGLFILLVAGSVTLWRRGRLQHIAVLLWSNLLQLLHRSSLLGQVFALSLWNFLVAQRQVLNLLAVLMLWGAALLCYALCSLGSLGDKLPSALIVITLFAGLNAWRWRLQDETSNPGNFLRRWIVSKNVWPPRIIWVVAVITLAFILLGIVNQLFVDAGVKDFTQLLSDIGLVSSLAVLAIGILMDTKSLIEWIPMLFAVLYGFTPWLGAWIYRLTMPSARLARWIVIVIWLYAIGLTHIGQPGENYYFTFGGMVVVAIWYIWMERMRGPLQRRWPTIAEKIYGGAGSIYFSGALVGLAITALLLIPRLELLAEQVAVVVYYCLVVGTVKEILSLRRTQSSRTDSPRQPDSPA